MSVVRVTQLISASTKSFGLAEHVKGKMKEVAGKVIGDSKLENEKNANSVATILLQPRSSSNY